jgi:anthraniloyl-CoA monooxygenase
MSARISATDWMPGGITDADVLALARALKSAGCDVIDVSTGQTVPEARPIYGRMFQTPWSDLVRHEVGIATITVGNVQDWDQVNTILAAGRADLVALARPHLLDPYFTLHAAVAQGWTGVHWPSQYLAGRPPK